MEENLGRKSPRT